MEGVIWQNSACVVEPWPTSGFVCGQLRVGAGLIAPTHNSIQMSLRLAILGRSGHPTLGLAVDIAVSLLGLMIHMI